MDKTRTEGCESGGSRHKDGSRSVEVKRLVGMLYWWREFRFAVLIWENHKQQIGDGRGQGVADFGRGRTSIVNIQIGKNLPFTLRHVLTGQQIIVQSARLVDRAQRRCRQMKPYHFVQRFTVHALHKDIGLEFALVGFHTKRQTVSTAHVLAIVQSSSRSVASKSTLTRSEKQG